MKPWHALALIVALFAISRAGNRGLNMLTGNRNVRNNNPLNIRVNPSNQWEGASGDDGEFVVFESPEYGFRAAYKTLQTYARVYGFNTIGTIVNRWAPAADGNDPDAYAAYLADKLNKFEWTPVSASEMPDLLYYMAEYEGAKSAFNYDQINKGIALA